MNKVDLVKVIAEETELTQKDVLAVIDAFIASTTKALANGDEVNVAGFGKFVARKRAARTSINPKTKEEISVPASIAPAFKPGKALKEAVNK